MTCIAEDPRASVPAEGYAAFASRMEREGATLGALIRLWHFRWQSRRQLERMEDRELADIGITREDAAAEARKPFWKA
jgi:uncharacterized protein YjiS (DUF1127 family)